MKTALLVLSLIVSTHSLASSSNCAEGTAFDLINNSIERAASSMPAQEVSGLKLSCNDTMDSFLVKLDQVAGLAKRIAELSVDSANSLRERQALRQAAGDLNSAAGEMLLIGTKANFLE